MTTKIKDGQPLPPEQEYTESAAGLLRELVAHLRQNRTQLREEWARRITRAQLLTAMTEDEYLSDDGKRPPPKKSGVSLPVGR